MILGIISISNPVDTGSKRNVHKTFRRLPGRTFNLRTFNLRPVSTRKAHTNRKITLERVSKMKNGKKGEEDRHEIFGIKLKSKS